MGRVIPRQAKMRAGQEMHMAFHRLPTIVVALPPNSHPGHNGRVSRWEWRLGVAHAVLAAVTS